MIHISLPEKQRPLPFYLAMEEVVARHFDCECFFTWVVKPTVIFGRNQVMEAEVDVAYCRENGIQLVRRKSGGGCVYADTGNVMLSYITPTEGRTVEEVFRLYLEKTAAMLRSLDGPEKDGVSLRDVIVSGRNDLLLDGRKFSGNALYLTPDKRHTIAHGTMLYSTDIDQMIAAITPTQAKLSKKGVKSVRQRVMNIAPYAGGTLEDFRESIISGLCQEEFAFTDEMIRETEELMQQYINPQWIEGRQTQSDDSLFLPEFTNQ